MAAGTATFTKETDIRFSLGPDTGYLNEELGIRRIKLFKPSPKQQGIGIVTTMVVDAGIGETRILVMNSKQGEGQLYLRGPQSKSVSPEGFKYYDEVKISKAASDYLLSLLNNYVERENVQRIKLK